MTQSEGMSPPSPPKKAPPKTEGGFRTAWKKTWSDPKFLAAAITVVITGMITGLTAIFVAVIQNWNPAPKMTPTVLPSGETPQIVQSCLNDFYDKAYTPVYEITLGLGASISPVRPFTLPFTLRFSEQANPVGGMKLVYLAQTDRFELIDHINASCITIFGDGRQHYLKNHDEYRFSYGEQKYAFTIQYDPVLDQLDVKLILGP